MNRILNRLPALMPLDVILLSMFFFVPMKNQETIMQRLLY